MTAFERLIEKSNHCYWKAYQFDGEKESNLRQFWINAAEGFRAKAMKLSIEEGAIRWM